MSTTSDIEKSIAEGFNESARDFCCRYKEQGLSKSSKILMDWLIEEGLANHTLLDLGCGAGSFVVEALKKGASSSRGVDLSPEMIRTANSLAHEMGLERLAKFELGNAAFSDLPPSDFVVLDKVICCYPEATSLIKNASSAGNRIGIVIPRDEGLWKWPIRIGSRIEKIIDWARGRGSSRFYIHPPKKIDEAFTSVGFVKERRLASMIWLVLLYTRSVDKV